MSNPYAVLGLHRGAPLLEVRKAFRAKALEYHPDRNPDGTDMFKAVNAAYEAITNPSKHADNVGGAGATGGTTRTSAPQPPPRPSMFSGFGDNEEKIQSDRAKARGSRVPLSAYNPFESDLDAHDFEENMQQHARMERLKRQQQQQQQAGPPTPPRAASFTAQRHHDRDVGAAPPTPPQRHASFPSGGGGGAYGGSSMEPAAEYTPSESAEARRSRLEREAKAEWEATQREMESDRAEAAIREAQERIRSQRDRERQWERDTADADRALREVSQRRRSARREQYLAQMPSDRAIGVLSEDELVVLSEALQDRLDAVRNRISAVRRDARYSGGQD